MQNTLDTLPVAVIGAGPIGLSAAVHLRNCGYRPILFEAGAQAAANLARWGHVRMFSPWSYNLDPAATALLRQQGWREPAADAFPTGRELLQHYLLPLAAHPEIAPHLHLETNVRSVSRLHHDVLRTPGRDDAPFVLRVADPDGERDVIAQAVIDASGTYQTPNWLGAHGLPALGECAAADAIAYGVPDILGSARAHYAGKSVLVVGAGHSAYNALQDLAALAGEAHGTNVLWGVRCTALSRIVRSPANDALQERRRLEERIQELLALEQVQTFTGLEIEAIERQDDKLIVRGSAGQLLPVDRIIAATGFRPDLSLLAELRLSLDPTTQSPTRLAPLIDPNLHSCGSVPEHGITELSHPERGVYTLGIKSYGRAPTFLLRTGYQQVRSVVGALGTAAATAPPCSAPVSACQG
ncbi:MAG: NAD(P)-binding domain-containing protein [Halioglobus sp.]|nr:NAD(P)-binding domain-containing protein [Halioglobus sp.]